MNDFGESLFEEIHFIINLEIFHESLNFRNRFSNYFNCRFIAKGNHNFV